MKLGPNPSDRLQIKRLALEGRSPEEISNFLRIDLKAVESWTQHFIDEQKTQQSEKVKAEKAAKEAAEKAAAEERERLKEELRQEILAEQKAAPKVNK